jgi:PAS domain S-box-containing protein
MAEPRQSLAPLSGERAEPTREAVEPAILVVDDRPANIVAFQAVLQPLGHPLVTATTGHEALERLQEREFALILLDVQMPGMSGFELATSIKSDARLASIPIIFVTALSRETAQVFSGYAHGAVDYLLKPFEPEMLRAKVRVFSELYRAQRTVRRQAELLHEHELREVQRRNEERFRQLTESLPLPVWGVRRDGTVYVCNGAWTEYSGLSADETGSILAGHWVHPLDAQRALAAWAEGTAARVPFDIECRLRRADAGSFRWHLLRAVPERGSRASEGAWIVAGVDVEAQRTAQDERARMLEREQRAREQAEAANRMKDDFLATVSHELRTPLNAILSWAQVARTGALDAGGLTQAFETIERNAQAQAKLVGDLLDISRIVSGKLLLDLGPLDLHTVVGEAVEALRPAAEAKRIRLRWQHDGPRVPMTADASRLRQIVWNLVSNAVKFTAPGGSVDVHTDVEDGRASIVVDDTGQGISPDFLPYVFDRFRQEVPSGGHPPEGLGIGLSIVKHLVELHGGRAFAESAGPGRGARFTVVVPTGVTS